MKFLARATNPRAIVIVLSTFLCPTTMETATFGGMVEHMRT